MNTIKNQYEPFHPKSLNDLMWSTPFSKTAHFMNLLRYNFMRQYNIYCFQESVFHGVPIIYFIFLQHEFTGKALFIELALPQSEI